MAGKGSKVKSLKSSKKSSGIFQVSDLKSQDAAKRRAALELAVRRKIESEKRALQIVERLLEDDVTEDFLLDCCRFISPAHYKDTVEERFIIRSCGYPICNKKLENVPKQKYRISTKTNKVYDITERKCFCSNFCFRASKYYEAQIPNSPVWMREGESLPDITLLKEGKSGHSGVEVKLSEKRIKTSDIEKPVDLAEGDDSKTPDSDGDVGNEPEQEFISSVIGDAPITGDREIIRDKTGLDNLKKMTKSHDKNQSQTEITERLHNCTISEHEKILQTETYCLDSKSVAKENKEVHLDSKHVEILGVTQRAVSKRGAEQLRKILGNSSHYQSALKHHILPAAAKGSMLDVLTHTLNEWKTEETLNYLFGSNWSSEVSDQVEDLDEDDLSVEANDLENTSEIPRADHTTSLNESLPFHGPYNTAKPVTDYSKLKEETEYLQIKVQEFFKGHYILPEEVEHEQKGGKATTSWAPALPLVDSCSQQQIRKRIVLEKLKKVLPAILLPLQITYSDVSKELHNMVKTFRFTNKNITHTIPEWSVIAIVLLSALLPTMPLYKDSQQNPVYTQFISKLLEELHFQNEDLENLKHIFACKSLSN
ncbi:putative RNA polymerase II subunit B1 CTD phosphatase RPAP2 [Rhinophrynus dorsalis]